MRHPCHGAVYYLSARTSGMGIVTSGLYTLGGSWMWEIFCEAERPSINDLIYTTVGGITIGETVWRTGECILDRLKKRHRAGYTSPLTASLTMGYRHYRSNSIPIRTSYITLDLTYGDLFDSMKRGPFDYFDAKVTAVIGQSARWFNELSIKQQFLSRTVADGIMKKVVVGLYNHFDYYCLTPRHGHLLNDTEHRNFVYSEVGAVGPGIAYRIGQHTRWEQRLSLNGIMLGANPDYLYHPASIGYLFGSGYGARLNSQLSVGSWLYMDVKVQFSHLFTWAGYDDDKDRLTEPQRGSSIQGETGNTLTAIICPTIELMPTKHWGIQCSGRFFHTHYNYTYHPHTSRHAMEWQAGIKCRF